MLKWIGTARWTYNECLKVIELEKIPRTKKALRARVLNDKAIEKMQKPWISDTPYEKNIIRSIRDRRDEAMADLNR